MLVKYKLVLFLPLFFSTVALGQHADEGNYNDWDFGPHGVYGNLSLAKIKTRTYYKIHEESPQRIIVQKINPSGIVVNTAIVSFLQGILNEVDQADQWGEIYDYRNYQQQAGNVFKVKDFLRGKNAFLPCKYALYIYDKELLTEAQFYSFGGQLAEDRNGVAIIHYKRYDDPIRFAERMETSFFDAQRHPVLSKSTDYHTAKAEFDLQDNKISESYLGIHEEPKTVLNTNVSGFRYSYDADNNLIMDESHGPDNRITPNLSGVARVEREYDQGYLIRETRLDTTGNKVRAYASGDGVASITHEYDAAGNTIRDDYFDQDGKPMNNQAGVQEIASFYSPANMRTRVTYFDEMGRPCLNRDKINTTLFVKDEMNRAVQESNYGLDGQPIKTFSEQVLMLKRKFDQYGRVISTSYWADSNTKMPHWGGSYEQTITFDEDGQPIEFITLDDNGQPFVAQDGSSSVKLIYNTDGLLAERQFLDNNKPISRKRGVTMHYSIIKYGYDQSGKEGEITFWGTDRKPVDATVWITDPIAVHRIVLIYRGNRIIEEKYYKLDESEPFQTIDCLKNDFINLNGISIGRKNAN